jgi:hypothetical protein
MVEHPEDIDMTTRWILGIGAYVVLAAGAVAGNLAVMGNECLHCRLMAAGATASTAPKDTRKIMRYHGVNALKTVNDQNFVLYNGKWRKVGAPGRTLARG